MQARWLGALAAAIALAGCSAEPGEDRNLTQEVGAERGTASAVPPSGSNDEAQANPPVVSLAAGDIVLAEWRKAANRASCAPVSFTDIAAAGTPRRANFSGGWAVAWDQPGLRSAFGVAGTGSTSENAMDADAHRARLEGQWPYFRELPRLPQPAFAGLGVEGAGEYPSGNPGGEGVNSLAYVRIGGQDCDYNVWSRLGRKHLETLLDSLRLVER